MDIFQMSLSSAVMIAAVVMLRALALHKLPKKTFLALWGIAVLRLLVPFSIPSRFSVYTGLDMLKSLFSEKTAAASAAGIVTLPANIKHMPGAGESVGVVMSAAAISAMEILWLAGMCVCILFFIVAYIKCRREFKMSLPVKNDFSAGWLREHPLRRSVQIRQSDRIKAPLTYGVFRPVILLPKKTDWTDEIRLRYILTHEFTHIRCLDTLSKLVLTVAVCVHWFNPFVWMMYVLANRDIELSCDETVVRTFGETTRSAYASMLVCVEKANSGLTPLVNHFSKNAIEERIVSIMKTKKITMLSIILALVLVAGTATVFATQAAASGGGDTGLKSVSSPAKPSDEEKNKLPPYTFSTNRGMENYPEYFTYDKTIDRYFYDGRRVAAFFDDNVWNGKPYSSFSYSGDHTGNAVYIKTVRDPQTNKVAGMAEMTEREAEEINSKGPDLYDNLNE